MPFDLSNVMAALKASLQNPKQSMRGVLNMGLSTAHAAQALLVVAILNGLMSYFVIQMAKAAGEDVKLVDLSPLMMTVFHVAGMFLMAGAVHVIGRWFGGKGGLNGAIILVAWMQFILMFLQIAQIIAALALPPIAAPLATGVMLASLWLMANFTAELHGFSSLIKVLAGIIAATFAFVLLVILWFLLILAGVLNV